MPASVAEPRGSFPFQHPIEVRFRDTDAMGHVNSAVYLTYFESARAAYYAAATGSSLGIGATSGGRSLILAEARITYRSPVLFGERLVVACRIGWIGRSSFSMEYRLETEQTAHGAARLVAYGETVQVMYDYAAGRPEPVPDDVRARVEAFEGRRIPAPGAG